ncbi:hypothetical protein NP233_g2229 [Leucocoprinus birnbaumii]|uniref:DUF7729 domain-containing protein n=1 Tax=Leucocoprinus birnbaumii TaxID=56174 RepID=A0AAD5W4S6_9AGAR|nr:hypothetical protein NP233_g2229 [Leucocoprinus birnbaumii]
MFTPPPSPQPSGPKQTAIAPAGCSPSLAPPAAHAMSSYDQKRLTGCRFRWSVVIVPLVLVLITISTRYLTHPAAFDVFSSPVSKEWSQLLSQSSDWRLHKRHPHPDPDNPSNPPSSSSLAVSISSSSPVLSPSQTSTAQRLAPTVPSSPPVLPTPFPQPFDSQLTLNFSSVSCLQFFTNMTNSDAFRKCRPFSLLSGTSATFINAQSNLTLMNTLIWGTCNTNLGINQCNANMGWFSSSLQSACDEDLRDENSLAVETLMALNVYQLMYNVACTVDPQANTYCYIDAVADSSPADLYLYQLPLGIDLPDDATNFSCSTCSQGLLGTYASALSNSTLASGLTGLKQTYEASMATVNSACGANFAKTGVTNSALALRLSSGLVVVITLLLVIWTLAF